MSSVVSESSRNDQMSEMFVKLLNDESRWVRLAAYQELGKFIASFTAAESETSLVEKGRVEHFLVLKNSFFFNLKICENGT